MRKGFNLCFGISFDAKEYPDGLAAEARPSGGRRSKYGSFAVMKNQKNRPFSAVSDGLVLLCGKTRVLTKTYN
jgi:hypothetical protein